MSRLPEPVDRFIEEGGPMTAPLSPVDHEQSPDVARLMVGAGEALNPRIVLGNKENRLVQIPRDFLGVTSDGSSSRFSAVPCRTSSMRGRSSLVAWRKRGGMWRSRSAGADNQVPPSRDPLLQATPWVSNAARAIASRGPRLAHKTN
jgi:hypothetical protein